jgi:hypothetical protein
MSVNREGVEVLSTLSSLQSLHLSVGALVSPGAAASFCRLSTTLTSLVELEICESSRQQQQHQHHRRLGNRHLRFLPQLTSLRRLRLSDEAPGVTDRALTSLACLPLLESLDIHRCLGTAFAAHQTGCSACSSLAVCFACFISCGVGKWLRCLCRCETSKPTATRGVASNDAANDLHTARVWTRRRCHLGTVTPTAAGYRPPQESVATANFVEHVRVHDRVLVGDGD